jgi:BirA family biotin operon repressor/biotin-[acetyl-CoA-carboxylase] ligase
VGVVSSAWVDLDRPPLSERALRAALVRPGGFVTDLRVVAETGSTNDDLAALARDGAPEGTVLVAEAQTRGRGRLDRTWTSPRRAGLLFSVLLRPSTVPVARRTWIPLLAGLAVQQAVARLGTVETRLKWPNDLLMGDDLGKAGGILAQAAGDAVVVGVGLNVSTRRAELPEGGASLASEAAECTDRDPILRAVLRTLAERYAEWLAAPDRLRPAYEEVCDTIGRPVRARLPDGGGLIGTATGLDDSGRLVVRTADGDVPISAGDVTRLRTATTV